MFDQLVQDALNFEPTKKNDMRGRRFLQRYGEDHHRARLSNRAVCLIRKLHERGKTYPYLAEKFGVNKHYISKICRYERRVTA